MENKYLQDITDIKMMMNKSSQFISLSGFAGVLAGVYALVGAFVANELIKVYYFSNDGVPLCGTVNINQHCSMNENEFIEKLIYIAFTVLIASILTAFILTYNKAKRQNRKIWDATSKRLIINFSIPLFTGFVLEIILVRDGFYSLIAPMALIFYGLACINASKYTFRDVRYLGITIIIIGLFAANNIVINQIGFWSLGIGFWAFGFGVCHIVYGGLMWFKYDRN